MTSGTPGIDGSCDPRFAAVRDAFAENFTLREEVGAGVTVILGGRMVVDLWGGLADRKTGRAWARDTTVMVFSSTKGATALCAHLLEARGLLDLDQPVARYWPEFAAAGKEALPVRMLLNHRAGLPAIEPVMAEESLFDWQTMVRALAAQAPWWPPGTAHGYHAISFGFLVGEVVRRVSGRSLGRFFREQIAGPLGLELWIGLPESEESRVAALIPAPLPTEQSPFFAALTDRSTLTNRTFLNPPTLMKPPGIHSRAARAAEIPAANGIATARALAGLYAPLAEPARTPRLAAIDTAAVERMSRVESEGPDRVLLLPTRFALGFMKSMDNRPGDCARFGPNPQAFGHVGAGGSFGMADPVAGVAIGYAMNRMGPGVLLNERGQQLIDAVYRCF
jgi:CubicO group peptidase (beta-lactamase class C family)